MTEYAWVPTPEAIEHANVTRFMRAHGAADIDELRAPLGRRHRLVLAGRDRRPRAAVHAALRRDPRLQPRDRVDDLVHRRRLQRRRTRACGAGAAPSPRSSTRPRPARRVTLLLRRAVAGGRAGRRRPAVARRRPRRRRRRSTCRWCPRPRSRCYAIADGRARSRCRCSRASPRARSPRGCRTPRRKVVFTADGTWRRGKHALLKPALDEAVAACPSRRARRSRSSRLGLDRGRPTGRLRAGRRRARPTRTPRTRC